MVETPPPLKQIYPANCMKAGERILLVILVVALSSLGGCRLQSQPAQEVAKNHWFKPTSSPVISSPAVYDVDGDGQKEIAVGSWDGYFYLLDRRLNDRPGWPQYSPKGFFSSPALADLDGNGWPEIVVGSEAGKLFGWRSDGRPAEGFPIDLGYKLWASPTVLDGPRLAIGGREQMFVLEAHGKVAQGWPQPMNGWPDATAAYAPGLVTVTTLTPGDVSKGWLYAWHEDGTLLPGFPFDLSKDSDSSPALADFDGDGRWWIVFGDDEGWLHVVDTAARERHGFPVRTLGPQPDRSTPTPAPPGGNAYTIEASPAIADLNNDGRLEISVGSWDGRMYVWDDAGRSWPGWPIAVGDQIISSAALVDLDGDDRLDIVVGSKDHRLYGWTAEGKPLPGFPYDLGHHVFSSPWVGDLDGDGRADVVVGADNGIHVLTDVGPLGRAAWPRFRQNDQLTGRAENRP